MRNLVLFFFSLFTIQLYAQSPEIGLQLQLHANSFQQAENHKTLKRPFIHQGFWIRHQLSSRFSVEAGISGGALGEKTKRASISLPNNPNGPDRITYFPGTEWSIVELPVRINYIPIKKKGLFIYGMTSLLHLTRFVDVGGYTRLSNGTYLLNYEEIRPRLFERGTYSLDLGGGIGYRFKFSQRAYSINAGFQSGIWNSNIFRLSMGACYYIYTKKE